jgi:GNAT superfamily N-acetyltransferase
VADYRIRPATLDDEDTLVTQRVRMFADMDLVFDHADMAERFRHWIRREMPAGSYYAWVAEADGDGIVAGGGLTVLPWPPGPQYPGGRVAFVYNVYTVPSHRTRGLARRIMETMHTWCRREGIQSLALNASRAGQPLYETMGYSVATSPMMFLLLK